LISKATAETPRWFNVDVKLVKKTRLMPLSEIRSYPELAHMRILQKGNRLSITPVDPRRVRNYRQTTLNARARPCAGLAA
jgi:predicted RNA-binding protein with PUA-like domain